MLMTIDRGGADTPYILRSDRYAADVTGQFAQIQRLDGTGNILIIRLPEVGNLDGILGAASRALYSLEKGDQAGELVG